LSIYRGKWKMSWTSKLMERVEIIATIKIFEKIEEG
jgi:hypothetical protein